jgi:multidrug transporter EmrE-like cation transporter
VARFLLPLGTVALGCYGQLIVKWQVDRSGGLPASLADRLLFMGRLLVNPWVLSSLVGAAIAAVLWFAAMTQFELSRLYPFIGLTFVFVLAGSVALFGEALTWPKVVGVLLIVTGVVVAST